MNLILNWYYRWQCRKHRKWLRRNRITDKPWKDPRQWSREYMDSLRR